MCFLPWPLLGLCERVCRVTDSESCTVAVLDMFPKKYWWPILLSKALKSKGLAVRDDGNALLVPSRKGWERHQGIPGDLWSFAVCF